MGHRHHAKPARDVALVKKKAIGYWEVGSRKKKPTLNKKPKLGVLAVIGPAEFKGKEISEAVLLELGVWRTRPYRESNLYSGRLPIFPMEREDYQRWAPKLFKYLVERSSEQIATRKCDWDNPFYVKMTKHFIGKQRRGVIWLDKKEPVPPGVRFSASVHDELLIRDLYYAELFLNKKLAEQLAKLGRYIDKLLSFHRKGSAKYDISRLGNSQFFSEAKTALGQWPRYLQIETLLHHLPGKRKNFFFVELCQMMGFSSRMVSSPERTMAEWALDGAKKRLGDIQLRLVWPKGKVWNANARQGGLQFVVFEVFPPKPPNYVGNHPHWDEVPF